MISLGSATLWAKTIPELAGFMAHTFTMLIHRKTELRILLLTLLSQDAGTFQVGSAITGTVLRQNSFTLSSRWA